MTVRADIRNTGGGGGGGGGGRGGGGGGGKCSPGQEERKGLPPFPL